MRGRVKASDGERPCIAFTGGGTGGHVFPGLAVIERLRERWDGRIVWIGSGKEVERRAVEGAGVEFFAVPSGKLRRSPTPANVADAFRVIAGYFASRRILADLRPRLLFSKGGYVSVPPCYAAADLGIPVFTHESDLTPGLATRLNAARAEKVLVSWKRTASYLAPAARSKATAVGNPVRRAIGAGDAARGRAWLGFEPGLPVVLVLGGSQGAREVNRLVEAALPRLKGAVAIAHQTGPGNPAAEPAGPRYKGFEFVGPELPDILAASTIVVGRAGAGTVWESSIAGLPMILVPLAGKESRGDQVDNAKMLEENGAAICLVGEEASPDRLAAEIAALAGDPDRRRSMAEAARSLARPDAAEAIAAIVLDRIGEEGSA